MAGCGQCPDQCGCVITDENGVQYAGAGNSLDPIVIPRALNTPWEGTSDDGSITITPGDVVDPNDDGHAPDFAVNFCNITNPLDVEDGDILVVRDEDADCRPHRLRDPLEGEFLGRDSGTGRAAWVQGAVISGGEVPFGVPLEFWGTEASVPGNYALCYGQLIPIASAPQLYAMIGHNANGGVDPGGGQFRIPDKRGVTTIGRDDMGGVSRNLVTAAFADILGGTGGVETVALAIANLPAHNHGVNDPGHSHTTNNPAHGHGISDPGHVHGIVADGAHFHYPGSGSVRGFVTFIDPPLNVLIANDTPDTLNLVVSSADLAQKNNAATDNEPNHSHGGAVTGAATGVSVLAGVTAVTVNGAGTGITTQNAGSGTAHQNMQPTVAANFIMRLT